MGTKLLKFVFAVLFLLPVCANATPVDVNIYSDTTISSGEYGKVNIYDTPPDQTTVTMTGGSADSVWSFNSSVFKLQSGNVSLISAHNTSDIIVSGGIVGHLELFDSTIVYISGGNITGYFGLGALSIAHISGKNFETTYNGAGWLIEGNWSDNSQFAILYRTGFGSPAPGSPDSQVILHIIPEPCMLGLAGFSFLILRRKHQDFL